jgi:hypothetical protein
MKVQFDTGRLRLRITRAELQSLRTAATLSAGLEWPAGGWRVEVVAAAAPGFDANGGTLRLAFAESALDALEARLPARDGLRETLVLPGGPIDVRFEVDLHDGRRAR